MPHQERPSKLTSNAPFKTSEFLRKQKLRIQRGVVTSPAINCRKMNAAGCCCRSNRRTLFDRLDNLGDYLITPISQLLLATLLFRFKRPKRRRQVNPSHADCSSTAIFIDCQFVASVAPPGRARIDAHCLGSEKLGFGMKTNMWVPSTAIVRIFDPNAVR
jgi:hypothetical protein